MATRWVIPTRANGQPAFGMYIRDPGGTVFHATGLICAHPGWKPAQRDGALRHQRAGRVPTPEKTAAVTGDPCSRSLLVFEAQLTLSTGDGFQLPCPNATRTGIHLSISDFRQRGGGSATLYPWRPSAPATPARERPMTFLFPRSLSTQLARRKERGWSTRCRSNSMRRERVLVGRCELRSRTCPNKSGLPARTRSCHGGDQHLQRRELRGPD